jgi:hypothetical protein
MAHRLGSEIKLRVDRGALVRVVAPDLSVREIEAPNGHFSLVLDQLGLWTYEWDGAGRGRGQLEVDDQVQATQIDLIEDQAVPRRVLPGHFSTGSP